MPARGRGASESSGRVRGAGAVGGASGIYGALAAWGQVTLDGVPIDPARAIAISFIADLDTKRVVASG